MQKASVRSYRDLDVWKRSIKLVTHIYKVTEKFPSSERYGLQIQIRQAAVSIPSNIAEGHARWSPKEFLNFISIALGSAAELETQILIAQNLGWLDGEQTAELEKELSEIGRMIRGLQKSLHALN